jgi:WD40 repeat protein
MATKNNRLLSLASHLVLAVSLCFASTPVAAVPALLVGAANGSSVERFDGQTGAFIDFFTSGGPMINGPSGLAIGPNGNLFVSQWSGGGVYQYDGATGNYVNTFIPNSDAPPAAALTFGPDGNLYVEGNGSDHINRYNGTTGALIDTFVSVADNGGLPAMIDMTFGPNGNLFVSHTYALAPEVYNVLEYDGTTGGFLGEFVTNGSGGLSYAAGLVFGPDGNLYVSDLLADVVRQYNGTTGDYLGDFASGGGLNGPWGLTFGPDNNLYVAGHGPDQVFRYNGTTGAFMDVFATTTNESPTFLVFAEEAGPIPEPSTLVLMGLGLVGLGFAGRRKLAS